MAWGRMDLGDESLLLLDKASDFGLRHRPPASASEPSSEALSARFASIFGFGSNRRFSIGLRLMATATDSLWERADAFYKAYQDGSAGPQAAADDLEMELDNIGMTYTTHLDSRNVGVDPLNRKIMHDEIPQLMQDVGELGFSLKACQHALAAEEIPGERTIEQFNQKEVANSAVLAPIEEGSIQVGSLACSHLNSGFRAINAQMPTSVAHMAEDGRWSKRKIEENCKNGKRSGEA